MEPEDFSSPYADSAPPIDSIAAFAAIREEHLPAFEELVRWLGAWLKKDQFARLNEGGYSADQRTPLAKVFVDLVAGLADPEPNSADEPLKPGIIAELLQKKAACAPRPMRASFYPRDEQAFPIQERNEPPPHTVLIGGPGQGKSTIVQYFSQLHRLCFLLPFREMLDASTRATFDVLQQMRDEQGLPPPLQPLFPLFVPLSRFADWLHENNPKERAIEMFLCAHAQEMRFEALSPQSIHIALKRLPWLLVLDGLDEVTDAKSRIGALEAIETFLQTRAEAPCLVVGTTRPQGYADELGGLCSTPLAEMSLHRARHYARLLLKYRHPEDGARQALVESRLEHAAKDSVTARLLRSPLQVTIMTCLLEESARAPIERWRLFREFYQIVLRRESDRNAEIATVVTRFRTHIDAIHERVGLILHTESEQGQSDASLDEARFMDVVEQRLTEEGFRREDAAKHAKTLARVAQERLVFLTGVRAGRVGFELRSFQEYMAAQALFQGRESAVLDRVRAIARPAHWRNVLLFMASRSFAHDTALREDLTIALCRKLDDVPSGSLEARVMPGAWLALDLLNEGAIATAPNLLGELARYALRLLDIANVPLLRRVIDTFLRLCRNEETQDPIRALVLSELERRLLHSLPQKELAAWVLVIALADEGIQEAYSLVEKAWPEDATHADEIVWAFKSSFAARFSGVIEERLPRWWPRRMYRVRFWDESKSPRQWFHAWTQRYRQGFAIITIFAARMLYRLLSPGDPLNIPEPFQEDPYWRLAGACAHFENAPSAQTLGETLRLFAEHYDQRICKRLCGEDTLSWVLGACLWWAESAEDFRELAAKAEAGELGDLEAWRQAEARWQNQQTTAGDIDSYLEQQGLPHRQIGEVGVVMASWQLAFAADNQPGISSCLAGYRQAKSERVRRLAGRLLCHLSNWSRPDLPRDPLLSLAELQSLANESPEPISVEAVLALTQCQTEPLPLRSLLWLVEPPRLWRRSAGRSFDTLYCERLLPFVSAHREHRRLLRLLTHLVATIDDASFVEWASRPDPNDDLLTQVAVSCFAAKRGGLSLDQGKRTASLLLALLGNDDGAGDTILGLLKHRENKLSDGDVALLEALTNGSLSPDTRLYRNAFSLLKHHLDTLPTTLRASETWKSLLLPLPGPQPPPSSRSGKNLDDADSAEPPFLIRYIDIRGFRCYENAKIGDLDPAPDQGQWLVLLGENSSGKTTLLRALAMALGGTEVGDYAIASSPSGAAYRRYDAEKATIDVGFGAPNMLQASILGESGGRERCEPSPSSAVERPFVVAYGCRRGSALGGVEKGLDFSRLAATRSLFDDSPPGLIHAETWLRNLEHATHSETNAEAAHQLYVDVCEVLTKLLPNVDKLWADPNGVWLKGEVTGGIQMPLAVMSDGYLTSIGWIVDMMARWIDRGRQQGRKSPAQFYEKMTGVVLLDELDLHLHPRWQIQVIRDLRRLFKRMTFVVTTHNAMTLVGARPGEIWCLKRDPNGAIVAERANWDPRLNTGSELFAHFFGLSDVYPDELGKKLRRYGFLASSPYRTDEEEREVNDLFADLKKEQIDPGFEPTQRLGS